MLRDGPHALGGEYAAALPLPVLVLLKQHRPHQAGDRGIDGDDSDDAGATFNFLIHPLPQVGAPNLAPVVLGEALRQRGRQIAPALINLLSALLDEHAAQGGGEYALVAFGDPLQKVAGDMYLAALPASALQNPPDRVGAPPLGLADLQLAASEPALLERANEFVPEACSFTSVYLDSEQRTPAIGVDAMASTLAHEQTCMALPSRPWK